MEENKEIKENNKEINKGLNLCERREESVCEELYEALFQLEQASQRVRKALIDSNNRKL